MKKLNRRQWRVKVAESSTRIVYECFDRYVDEKGIEYIEKKMVGVNKK